MIPSAELPAAILHVAGCARDRLALIAPVVDPKVEAIVRGHVAKGVTVEVVHHPRIKAVIAEEIALRLSTSITAVGTGLGFVPEVESGAPNVEGAVLLVAPHEVAALLAAATS